MGDMNGKVSTDLINDVMGVFGMPGMNNNGRRLIDICNERGLCLCNSHFKHKDVHKYTWVCESVVRNGRSLIDCMIVEREILRYVCDIKVLQELCGGVSDHMIVLRKVRLRDAWRPERPRKVVGGRLKVRELHKREVIEEHRSKVERLR